MMENNIDNIHNNLVWKFYGENKYPLSIYRDSSSSVIRDKRNAYLFFDHINGASDNIDVIRKINNVTQFAEHIYINHTDKKDILLDNSSVSVETMHPNMKFYFPGELDEKYFLGFYFFKLNKEGIIQRYDIRSDEDESITYINSSFAMLGDALTLRIHDELSKFYEDYLSSHQPPKKSFLDKLFKRNKVEEKNITLFDFLDKIKLVDIANELTKSYIYDKNSSDIVNFSTLRDVTVVISIG